MDVYDERGRLVATTSSDTAMGYHVGGAIRKILSISPRAAWGAASIVWTLTTIVNFSEGKTDAADYLGAANLLLFLLTAIFSKTRALGIVISVIMLLGVGALALFPTHPFIVCFVAWCGMALFGNIAKDESIKIAANEEAQAQAKIRAAEIEAAKPKIECGLEYNTELTEGGVSLHVKLVCKNKYQKTLTMAKGLLTLRDPLQDTITEENFTITKPLAPEEEHTINGTIVFAENSVQAEILKHGHEIRYVVNFEKILFGDGTTFQQN